MKNVLRIAILGMVIFNFTSCKEEEDPIFDAPTFSVTAENSSVKKGQTTVITVNVSEAEGKVASIAGSVAGNGSIGAFSDLSGATNGSATATFTASGTAGVAVVTVVVTDQQSNAMSTTETVTINVTDLDPPSVALSSASDTQDIGGTSSVDITFGAEANLASYSISRDGEVVAEGALSGTSETVTFDYTVAARDPERDIVFTVAVTDSEGVENSTTYTVTVNAATPADRFALSFNESGNRATDPAFATNSIQPSDAGPAASGAMTVDNEFIDDVSYIGAVDPAAATPWYAVDTWSFYAHILLANGVDKNRTQGATMVTVTDGDLDGDGNADGDAVTWTKDKTYLLEGFAFVNDGQTLTIEAGTVIKGKAGQQENASALIVARGGTIMANGTSTEPIIMTFESDPLDGSTPPTTRGQWGGLIILGKAGLNSANGTTAIEGIPTSEPRGLYGGNTNDDSSGELHYVSIRHGGTDIGAGNEINGLTLGGVGSETVIDNVEIIGNVDDGIEWFGGTVNGTHLIVAFQGDDGLDYDEGYRGTNQFVIVHQDPSPAGDRGGEHDGGTSPETGTPYATPTFANVTSIGNGSANGKRALTFRDNAGGFYYNSIFSGYGRGVDIEDLADEQDSYKQFLDGNLGLGGCIFNDIGDGTASTDLFKISN